MRLLIILPALLALPLAACVQPAATLATLPTLTPSPVPTLSPTPGPTATATIYLTPTTAPLPAGLPTPGPGALGNPGSLASAAGIAYFAAAPAEVSPGEAATLFWSATGEGAHIDEIDPLGMVTQTWDVPLAGSIEVRPSLPGRDVRYLLTVSSGDQNAEAEVLVAVRCTLAWFFTPIPTEGCPDTEGLGSTAAVQDFEHGRMFWIEQTGEIIVIFNGSRGDFTRDMPGWLVFEDRYMEGELLPDTGLTPPAGRLIPRLRFGKPWAESADLRARLGWARTEVVNFNTLYQRETLGEAFSFYFADEGGTVIWLEPDQLDWDELGQRPGF